METTIVGLGFRVYYSIFAFPLSLYNHDIYSITPIILIYCSHFSQPALGDGVVLAS